MRPAVRATAAALAVAAALTACTSSQAADTPGSTSGAASVASGEPDIGSGAAAQGWRGTFVSDGYHLPTQRFTDTQGRKVTLAEAADRPVTLVFFGYSHCPDICSIVLANIASALRGAPADVRRDVRVLFVTTDPSRDTAPVTRAYLDRFDAEFEGLVAPVDAVAAAAKALYISYEKPDGSHGGATYEVDHGTYTTAFLRGRAHVIWSQDTAVAALRSDLTRLAGLA